MLVLSDRSFLASSVHHPGTSLVAQGRRQQPFLRSKTRIAFKRLLQQCRAGKQPPPDGAGGGKGKPGSGQDVEATLKQLGIDRPTARKVLQVWRQAVSCPPARGPRPAQASLNDCCCVGCRASRTLPPCKSCCESVVPPGVRRLPCSLQSTRSPEA